MTITIITVGAKPKHEIATLIESYVKRLPKHIRVVWHFVKHGPSSDPDISITTESESIMRIIPKNNTVILLDESGQSLSSPQVSDLVFKNGTDVTFIIGGAYGVSGELKNQARIVLALGKIVYPHQIVRLILSEQLYRAYAIYTGHPYHHR